MNNSTGNPNETTRSPESSEIATAKRYMRQRRNVATGDKLIPAFALAGATRLAAEGLEQGHSPAYYVAALGTAAIALGIRTLSERREKRKQTQPGLDIEASKLLEVLPPIDISESDDLQFVLDRAHESMQPTNLYASESKNIIEDGQNNDTPGVLSRIAFAELNRALVESKDDSPEHVMSKTVSNALRVSRITQSLLKDHASLHYDSPYAYTSEEVYAAKLEILDGILPLSHETGLRSWGEYMTVATSNRSALEFIKTSTQHLDKAIGNSKV